MNNKEYILNKIMNTDVSDYPWKHLIIKDFLPPNLYNGIKQEILPYTEDAHLRREQVRAFHIFANQSVGVMPDPDTPNLLEYYNILLDESIFNAIKSKLPISDFSESQRAEDFYSELNFFTRGFNYGEVHPDRSDKLISMIHYLAEEDDDESLGTFLYSPDKDGSDLDVFKDKLKTAPYISNCACLFAPYDTPQLKTNHCMANNSSTTFLRSSFINTWMREKSDETKDPQSGRIRLPRLKSNEQNISNN